MTSVAATRPSRSTVARSVISITSSTSWLTKITLAPLAVTWRTRRKSWSTSRLGRKGVGSSSTSRPLPAPLSSPISCTARTMASSARCTGARSATRASGSRAMPKLSKRRTAARRSAVQLIAQSCRSARRPTSRFSSTVRLGTRPRCWWTKLMRCARNAPGARGSATSAPQMRSRLPASGGWKPASTLMRVDFARAVLPEQAVHLPPARPPGRRRRAPSVPRRSC